MTTRRVEVEESGERMFGSLVESKHERRSGWRLVALQIAIAVHMLVLCVIMVKDYFEVPIIQEPPLRVSFAQVAPPPPPPPAPPKPAAPKPEPEIEVPPPEQMLEPVEM